MPDRDIRAAVAEVQRSVVVPKARYNAFGKFSYRSYEDIVSALKEPDHVHRRVLFTPELVVRGSTAALRSLQA